MRRFKKKPELAFAVIPGLGRISDDRVIEGDQFAKFAPSLLVEVLPAAVPVSAKSAPKPPPAVIVPPPPAVTAPRAPSKELLADTVETPINIPPEARRPSAMEDAGFVSPEKLVAAVDAENKQTEEQIEKAVERLAPVEEKKPEPKKEEKKPAPKPSVGKKPSGRK